MAHFAGQHWELGGQKCEFNGLTNNCTVNFHAYDYLLSNFPFMSFTIFENSNGKILQFLPSFVSCSMCFPSRDCLDCFVVILFSFVFSMPSKVLVLGHKYVLGPSQAHFKMSLSRAQNIFMRANINSIVLLCWASHKLLSSEKMQSSQTACRRSYCCA